MSSHARPHQVMAAVARCVGAPVGGRVLPEPSILSGPSDHGPAGLGGLRAYEAIEGRMAGGGSGTTSRST